LRKPPGEGPFPIVLMASGNGGGGMALVRELVRNRGFIMERLLEAGYASAWLRYRAEVELGYNKGGKLIEDVRQGRQLLNRLPLDHEDEIAIIEHVKKLPYIDPERVGILGMSHGGEMVLKITSEYGGVAAGVASEPASHEFLVLSPDKSVTVDEETKLRNLEEMQMAETAKVRARIDMETAMARIAAIDTPLLVMGRERDHLQGIFRTTYELLEEAGKNVEWVSFEHPDHGYVFPVRGKDGAYAPNEVQNKAISKVIGFFDRHLKP
ncbi:MAG: prolyl oligopeptidase family serine peptidase, partial [bacterium]